jgi:hypothetical protein
MRSCYKAALFDPADFPMQRVPFAEFEPKLAKRLEELWGRPVNLYRALGNSPIRSAMKAARRVCCAS